MISRILQTNIMSDILKLFRRQLGLTQKEFAEKINTTRGAIAQIEAGNNYLNYRLSHQIYKIFKIDLDDIVLKDNYLYNKVNNELLCLKYFIEVEDNYENEFISVHDLEIINKGFSQFPHINIIKSSLRISEKTLKFKLSVVQNELKTKLRMNNKICYIAEFFNSTNKTNYKNIFVMKSEKDYLESVNSDFESTTETFDDIKLRLISQIHHLEILKENLTFEVNCMLDSLREEIEKSLSID